MTKERLMNELEAKGFVVQEGTAVKNGITMETIIIGEGDIRPTIYPENFEHFCDYEIENVINELVMDIEKAMKNAPSSADTENYKNWNWAKKRLMLCIQQEDEDEIVTRDFLDLKQYVRIMVPNGSIKVTKNLFYLYKISEDELFEAAYKYTKKNQHVQSMFGTLVELGFFDDTEKEEVEKQLNNLPPQLVITNNSKNYGASTVCDMDLIRFIANSLDSDLVILPSSIHECIFMAYDNSRELDEFTALVQEINETEVRPEERLSNHAYLYKRDEDKIVW